MHLGNRLSVWPHLVDCLFHDYVRIVREGNKCYISWIKDTTVAMQYDWLTKTRQAFGQSVKLENNFALHLPVIREEHLPLTSINIYLHRYQHHPHHYHHKNHHQSVVESTMLKSYNMSFNRVNLSEIFPRARCKPGLFKCLKSTKNNKSLANSSACRHNRTRQRCLGNSENLVCDCWRPLMTGPRSEHDKRRIRQSFCSESSAPQVKKATASGRALLEVSEVTVALSCTWLDMAVLFGRKTWQHDIWVRF